MKDAATKYEKEGLGKEEAYRKAYAEHAREKLNEGELPAQERIKLERRAERLGMEVEPSTNRPEPPKAEMPDVRLLGEEGSGADEAMSQGNPRANHKVSNGRALPGKGEPNSSADLLNPDGTVKQRRYYGDDGKPQVDIDFNHTDDGTHTFPHRHIWDWDKNPPPQDGM